MTIDTRISFEISEETRARWQLAADKVGMDLIEWITDNNNISSDPESGWEQAKGDRNG